MRRPFTDSAGHTRHCWECEHATNWRAMRGWCEAYEMTVTRSDSPNNCCSRAGGCEHYDRRD